MGVGVELSTEARLTLQWSYHWGSDFSSPSPLSLIAGSSPGCGWAPSPHSPFQTECLQWSLIHTLHRQLCEQLLAAVRWVCECRGHKTAFHGMSSQLLDSFCTLFCNVLSLRGGALGFLIFPSASVVEGFVSLIISKNQILVHWFFVSLFLFLLHWFWPISWLFPSCYWCGVRVFLFFQGLKVRH